MLVESSIVPLIGGPDGLLDWTGVRFVHVTPHPNGPHGAHDRWRSGRPPTQESVEAAVAALREQLDAGYYAVVNHGEGRATQVTELPVDADLVILRRPIAGG